jgi:hypothetical protein
MDKPKKSTIYEVMRDEGQNFGSQHYLNGLIDRKVAVLT